MRSREWGRDRAYFDTWTGSFVDIQDSLDRTDSCILYNTPSSREGINIDCCHHNDHLLQSECNNEPNCYVNWSEAWEEEDWSGEKAIANCRPSKLRITMVGAFGARYVALCIQDEYNPEPAAKSGGTLMKSVVLLRVHEIGVILCVVSTLFGASYQQNTNRHTVQ